MNKPVLTQGLNSYLCHWPDPAVDIRFEHLSRERRQQVSAEVSILGSNGSTDIKGNPVMQFLGHAAFSLSSASGKEALFKKAGRKASKIPVLDAIPWEDRLDEACFLVLQEARKPEEAEEFTTAEDIQLPPYTLRPLLRRGQPTIIFGDGGTGKGLLACYCYICLSLPFPRNTLGFGVPPERERVLYLDWEADKDTTGYRLKVLAAGLPLDEDIPGPPLVPVLYRRCHVPLVEDMEAVDNIVQRQRVDTLIVDSLGPAGGITQGDPAGPAVATMETLRRFGKTSLIIGHIPKAQVGTSPTEAKRVYGSTFYTFLARHTWELRSSRISSGDTRQLRVALFDRKVNDAWPTEKPLGFCMSFEDLVEGSARRIAFSRMDITKVPELAQGLPLKDRLRSVLRYAQLNVKALAEQVNASEAVVRDALNTYKDVFCIVHIEGKEKVWGLSSPEEPHPTAEDDA